MWDDLLVRAIFAVVVAALCFSTTGTSRALAGVDASAIAVGAARILVGGTILAAIALWTRRGPAAAAERPTASRSLGRGQVLPILIGAAGVLAYQPLFFFGTAANGVAIGTVVTLGAAPIVTGIYESLRRHELPRTRWLIATLLAIGGVVLVSGLFTPGGVGQIDPVGLLTSAGAGTSYAIYTLASKDLLDQGWRPSDAMASLFGVAAVASLPMLLIAGGAWVLTPAGLALTAWLGVVTVALAYTLFGWGLARMRATTAATVSLAEPLGATLLGLLVLQERLEAPAVVGLVLIALGLGVLALPGHPKRSPVSASR